MKMIVTLHQQDVRCLNTSPYVDVRVMILKVKTPPKTPEEVYSTQKKDYEVVYSTSLYLRSRQNQSEEITLNKGHYIIIPYSTGFNLKTILRTSFRDCYCN
jgi:hypothetical protein